MGNYRTKEDDVASISTSVYVTNFPESILAKDLFKACRQYGHVVDSFIPNKKSKTGKRFGFVKFINVFSEERLINNLCTVWIDRFKLHANIARFQRPMGKKEENGGKKPFVVPVHSDQAKKNDRQGTVKSYRGALNGDNNKKTMEFASFANLKVALANEGFMDITIKYMGELWVVMEFKSEDSLRKFKKCISVLTWFSQVTNATNEFEVEERIAWIEVEGIPFRLWTKNTFTRIADKWGKLLDVDDQDDLCFHSKRLCVHMKSCKSIQEEFKIIHRGRGYWIRANETPGWVPDFTDDTEDEEINSLNEGDLEQKSAEFEENSDEEIVPDTIFEGDDVEKRVADEKKEEKEMENSADPFNIYSLLNRPSGQNNGEDGSHMIEKVNDAQNNCCENPNVKGTGNGSISSGHFKVSEVPKTGGSMIDLLEEVVKVGQDPNSLIKNNSTVSDYFVIVWGEWQTTQKKTMFIVVYAPQECKEKIALWDFLHQEIGKWNGDVIIMSDFNEVRSDGFQSFVENIWKNSPNEGSNALLILMNKLRFLKKQIRIWNKDNIGCRRKDQTQLKKKIDALEIAQKAKIKWAIDGDENSGFYHGIINKRRSIQSIRGVMVEGMWIDEPVKVKKEFFDHFANRFCKPNKPTVSIDVEFPNQIDPDQRSFLERDVSNSEIKKAVCECGMDKAPGPDGFSFGFFRHFWYLVDGEVYEAVMYLFTHFDLPKGCNSSFIALIP
nr:nucleotide-binding alpha-beta plait domain-containing protein [Tanacetum cinerariifolium]